jgi:hypothetical protein
VRYMELCLSKVGDYEPGSTQGISRVKGERRVWNASERPVRQSLGSSLLTKSGHLLLGAIRCHAKY